MDVDNWITVWDGFGSVPLPDLLIFFLCPHLSDCPHRLLVGFCASKTVLWPQTRAKKTALLGKGDTSKTVAWPSI